jgi:hypothetical protein
MIIRKKFYTPKVRVLHDVAPVARGTTARARWRRARRSELGHGDEKGTTVRVGDKGGERWQRGAEWSSAA